MVVAILNTIKDYRWRIQEWVAWHKRLGVDSLVVLDDGCWEEKPELGLPTTWIYVPLSYEHKSSSDGFKTMVARASVSNRVAALRAIPKTEFVVSMNPNQFLVLRDNKEDSLRDHVLPLNGMQRLPRRKMCYSGFRDDASGPVLDAYTYSIPAGFLWAGQNYGADVAPRLGNQSPAAFTSTRFKKEDLPYEYDKLCVLEYPEPGRPQRHFQGKKMKIVGEKVVSLRMQAVELFPWFYTNTTRTEEWSTDELGTADEDGIDFDMGLADGDLE